MSTSRIRIEERIRRREEEKRLRERRNRDREFKIIRDMTRKATMGEEKRLLERKNMGQKSIGASLVPGMTKAKEFKKRYGK
tara:strand:- start:511 stop:753 length:243 start_codon:yes stop_codon:yes gene_type:complete